jgi:quinol-cytochrome oxidoreductase complex cytochrome b subunit
MILNFLKLTVKYHTVSSIFGFFLVITLILQIVSGIVLSFSLVPESMIIPIVRDEEDIEVPYIDLLFWLHERGVDILFVLFYFHFLRKMYLYVLYIEQETTWKSGILSLLIFQVVTFLGLSLCCTHLSDITLAIACNIMHTFFAFKGKPYAFIFTDKKLNSDTIIRIAYAHYLSAFALLYIGIIHAVCMHYDWKSDYNFDGNKNELIWFDEVLSSELVGYFDFLFIMYLVGLYLFAEPEPLSYEIFMWGDIGAVNDVRFFGVAPHWYFRPFMAWLTVCPFHKIGVFGLLLFFFLMYNQISINFKNFEFVKTAFGLKKVFEKKLINFVFKVFSKVFFWVFFLNLMYTTTFLPSGRYYQIVYGNTGMLVSYLYVLLFLSSKKLKNPVELNNLYSQHSLIINK